ncbi:hypothetical protein FIBSPDRAFT_874708 [Athelia psychrophila]|uniref:BTB domain-containing protein n=1 Tax=Athelia psychrophila TaxID=1759441 RepID=A0A165X7P3_9AGAM|nr:hypothetical protein FIBSPDRAFT_874708 [Fibularhizoctonia sp. CBS 109695]
MSMVGITSTHAAFTTCSDIRFKDGNVVIQAEETLKVHRGVFKLGADSSVFKIFSMPQPPPSEGEVTVEGCPVVHLPDTAADVAIVLQALFLRSHVVVGGPLPMIAAAACLRLGKEYKIDPLHAERSNDCVMNFHQPYTISTSAIKALWLLRNKVYAFPQQT